MVVRRSKRRVCNSFTLTSEVQAVEAAFVIVGPSDPGPVHQSLGASVANRVGVTSDAIPSMQTFCELDVPAKGDSERPFPRPHESRSTVGVLV